MTDEVDSNESFGVPAQSRGDAYKDCPRYIVCTVQYHYHFAFATRQIHHQKTLIYRLIPSCRVVSQFPCFIVSYTEKIGI